MKLNEFHTTIFKYGHCEIIFHKPLIEQKDMYDIKLLTEFFGQKQHKNKLLKIYYHKNPWTIEGLLIRHKKHWAKFMEYINLDGRSWYSKMRDEPIMTVEEGLQILEYLTKSDFKIEGKIEEKKSKKTKK